MRFTDVLREDVRNAFEIANLEMLSDESKFRVEKQLGVDVPILSYEGFPLPMGCPVYFESSRKKVFNFAGTKMLFKTGVVGVRFRNPIVPLNQSSVEQRIESNQHAKNEYVSVNKELNLGLPTVRQHAVIECRENENLYIAEDFGDSFRSLAQKFKEDRQKYRGEIDLTLLALHETFLDLSKRRIGYATAFQLDNDEELLNRIIRFDRNDGAYEVRITSNPLFLYGVSPEETMGAYDIIRSTLLKAIK